MLREKPIRVTTKVPSYIYDSPFIAENKNRSQFISLSIHNLFDDLRSYQRSFSPGSKYVSISAQHIKEENKDYIKKLIEREIFDSRSSFIKAALLYWILYDDEPLVKTFDVPYQVGGKKRKVGNIFFDEVWDEDEQTWVSTPKKTRALARPYPLPKHELSPGWTAVLPNFITKAVPRDPSFSYNTILIIDRFIDKLKENEAIFSEGDRRIIGISLTSLPTVDHNYMIKLLDDDLFSSRSDIIENAVLFEVLNRTIKSKPGYVPSFLKGKTIKPMP